MLRRLVALIILGTLAVAGLLAVLKATYPFVLASEKARTAVEVTEDLSQELKAATHASDLIAFGILGSVISIVTALACSSASAPKNKIIGALAGMIVGFAGGVAAGAIGHWYITHTQWQLDPLVQWTLRWTLILLPIAIAAGIATAMAGNFRRDIGNAQAGAVIGAIAAALVFAVLHGSVTTMENFSVVMPGFFDNRILIVAAAMFGIGIGLLWQIKSPKADEGRESVLGSR